MTGVGMRAQKGAGDFKSEGDARADGGRSMIKPSIFRSWDTEASGRIVR